MHAAAVSCAQCLVIALFLACCLSAGSSSLIHLSLVLRHGHRLPLFSIPNDSHTFANTWLDGFGQLTDLGKRNQKELGGFLHRRYGVFLGPRYNVREQRTRSSDMDRTLMSAQICLAALFPVVGDPALQKSGIAFQAIPVHTVNAAADALLLPHKYTRCKRLFAELIAAQRRSEDYLRFKDKIDGYLRELSEKIGAEPSLRFETAYKVIDTLMVLKAANFTLPVWAREPATYARLENIGRFSWRFFAGTHELRRMRAGVLLDSLLSGWRDAADRRSHGSGGRRLAMYSGHDINLLPLLTILGNEDYAWPNYAACLIFELHSPRAARAQPTIRIFYRNDTQREPVPIRLPGCDLSCPLDRITRLLDKYRISADEFRDLCHSASATPFKCNNTLGRTWSLRSVSYGLYGVALVLMISILLGLMYFFCLRDRIQKREDRPAVAYHSLVGTVEN